MGQYQSHALDTIAYMEEYLDRFHRMKDIFLEFQVSKQTQAKVDKQQKELRHEHAQSNQRVGLFKRPQCLKDNCSEENELCMDIIHMESHFNFVKMYLL